MKNKRYTNALHISVPVPEGVKSGEPVKVGQICGVAIIDREADGAAIEQVKLEEYIARMYEQAEKQRGKLKPEDLPAE